MITFEGILIGTGIMWVLGILLVMPLTNYLVSRKLAQPAFAHIDGNTGVDVENPELNQLVTQCYIMADTLVLGIAGFLMGAIFGWFFIGISWEAKGWPGLIAFILMSMLGASM